MKYLLSLLVTLFCATTVGAENKSLVITFNDNTKTTYTLSTLPEITMANDKLTVKTSETTAEFDLYKVKTFTFATTSGISSVSDERFTIEGETLVFPSENAQIRIFSIDGKQVPIDPIYANGKAMVSLSALTRGIYIISANGKSVKITRQ